jgi:hypothetical protein
VNGDDRLRQLLSDAVSDIEPTDRLDELRASVRPRPKVVPMARSRWWYAATGIIATAAVIGIVAYVTHVVGDRATDLGPATDSGASPPATMTATDTSMPSPTASPGDSGTSAVYYLGEGPHGTVLYRELGARPAGTTALAYAVDGLMADPNDPDYRTPWHPGWLRNASAGGGRITVEVGDAPAARPASMSPRDASEAVQQVVYTLQAAVQRRDKVQFLRHGAPVASVLGVPTSKPVGPGQAVKVLSLMSISAPAEGAHVARGRLVVTGVNNGFEATVDVRLLRHGVIRAQRSGTASGAYDPDRLFPWRVALDTSALSPGRYTLLAINGSGTGGKVDHDTRTIFLR